MHFQVLLTAGHTALLKLLIRDLGLSLCGPGAEQLLVCHMLSGHKAVVVPACLRCQGRAQVARNPLVVAGRSLRVSRAHGAMPDWKVGPVNVSHGSRKERVLQVSHAHGIVINTLS